MLFGWARFAVAIVADRAEKKDRAVVRTTVLPGWQRALFVLSGAAVAGVALAILYLAKAILVPIVLAVFLTLILSPVVSQLRRLGIGRTPAVLAVVAAVAMGLVAVLWLITSQITSVVAELPKYSDNIRDKIKAIRRATDNSTAERLEKMIQDLAAELSAQPPGAPDGSRPQPSSNDRESSTSIPQRPSTVYVKPDTPGWLSWLPVLLGSVADLLGGSALALLLAVFMLLRREDLRNRVIRLLGHGRVTVTTKAVDDAGRRISRFLLMQLTVNGLAGLIVGTGLTLIGVEHGFLWGFLAGVLRYLPYFGIWIAALPPFLLSVAISTGWMQPLLVVGLFATLELINSNFVEPHLYGRSLGVSEVALLIVAAGWAYLWGPIGLVLSSPLAVCLVVLGKYVPQLEFLDILLGDQPALEPSVSYYQRLLARDEDEAVELVQALQPPEQAYDRLLLPTLVVARHDRQRGAISDDDEQFILQTTREILDDIRTVRETAAAVTPEAADAVLPKMRILGCPTRDGRDVVALEMLRQLLNPQRWELEILSGDLLSAELVAEAASRQPLVVCIAALPPAGLARCRYLLKRLRLQLPQARIVVGRWGGQVNNMDQNREQLLACGADEVDFNLLETRSHLQAWRPVLACQDKNGLAKVAI